MMEMFDAELGTGNELTTREHDAAEGRPIYRIISPLKDLAGITAAVTLYCPSFKKSIKRQELHTFKYGRENDIICNLAIPLSIRNLLGRYVNYAIDEIIEWCHFHNRRSITYQTCAVLFNNHHCEIVWKCDSEIDYQKTAVKMLSNQDLDAQEKFKIASSHCLENHMKKMWPLKSKEKIIPLISHPHTLISHWYQIFQGRIHRSSDLIKLWHKTAFSCHLGCYDRHESRCFYNLSVFIYFWKHLPSHEQESVAINLIRKVRGARFQKDLLLEMNASQQLKILETIRVGVIIVNFTLKQHHLDYAVLIWKYIRNTINQKQYIHMLTDILLRAEEFLHNIRSRNLIDFIEIMWETTPPGLQRYASDIKDGAVINLLTNFDYLFHFGARFAMLISIIPNIELRFRQNILRKISYMSTYSFKSSTPWERVIECTGRPLLFDKFVKLCIPNSEEQAEFKRKYISSEFMNHYGVRLIKNGEWKELDEFITIFESNIMSLAEYKIHLFTNLISTYDNYGDRIDKYFFDRIDWPHTPSHEWKRFCSGIDEERLIDVLTDFRGVTNNKVRYLVLKNLFPNFEVGSTRINFPKC